MKESVGVGLFTFVGFYKSFFLSSLLLYIFLLFSSPLYATWRELVRIPSTHPKGQKYASMTVAGLSKASTSYKASVQYLAIFQMLP